LPSHSHRKPVDGTRRGGCDNGPHRGISFVSSDTKPETRKRKRSGRKKRRWRGPSKKRGRNIDLRTLREGKGGKPGEKSPKKGG